MIRKSLVAACLYASAAIQPVLANESLDPDSLFQQAMKYRQNGELFKAIEIFETILSNQPDLNRARLELAVSYHLTRRFNEARQQLIQVLNAPDTPEKVKIAITAYLAQLDSDIKSTAKRSSSSIYLSVGALTDSNINLSPDLPSASEESASGAQAMFSYSNRSRASQPFNLNDQSVDFEWLSQLTAYTKAYASGKSDFNFSNLSINTGPALIAQKSWRTALNFKLDKVYFGNEAYAKHVGINPFFTYSLRPDFEITLENYTTSRDYDQQQDQGLTGTATSWSLDFAKFYSKQSIGLQAGFKYHDNGAKSGILHYSGAEVYLGGQVPAWDDARAYLTFSSRDYRYKSIDTLGGFTAKRDETELLAVLGLSHNFRKGALRSWTLNAEYTFTDNDTNTQGDPGQTAFIFDRSTFELNMRRYFF